MDVLHCVEVDSKVNTMKPDPGADNPCLVPSCWIWDGFSYLLLVNSVKKWWDVTSENGLCKADGFKNTMASMLPLHTPLSLPLSYLSSRDLSAVVQGSSVNGPVFWETRPANHQENELRRGSSSTVKISYNSAAADSLSAVSGGSFLQRRLAKPPRFWLSHPDSGLSLAMRE